MGATFKHNGGGKESFLLFVIWPFSIYSQYSWRMQSAQAKIAHFNKSTVKNVFLMNRKYIYTTNRGGGRQEFCQFSEKQTYIYITNCKKKSCISKISIKKLYVLATSHGGGKYSFLAYIYTTNYQDHFIILSCALYFKLCNFIKCYFL